MDKKNTMLLTVIAVATLLVAVVGATFAYFSVQVTNNTGTTTVTATAEEVGTIALTNPTTALKLRLTAADMAESLKGNKTYYATTTTVNNEENTSNYDTTAVPRQIALASLNGGTAGVKYRCKFTMTATVSGTMADSFVAGDAQVIFGGTAIKEHNATHYTGTTVTTEDLKTIYNADATTHSKTYDVVFETLVGGSKLTEDVTAYVQFNNTAAKQDYAQGKTLVLELTNNDDFTCDTWK